MFEGEAGEKDNFAVSVSELINALDDRVPGLLMAASCEDITDEAADSAQTEKQPDAKPSQMKPEPKNPGSAPAQTPSKPPAASSPDKQTQGGVSEETLALILILLLIGVLFFFVFDEIRTRIWRRRQLNLKLIVRL